MKSKQFILVGGFIEVIELCESLDYQIVGIIDTLVAKELYGYPVLGNDDNIQEVNDMFKGIHLILTPDDPARRLRLYQTYSVFDFLFQSIISAKAIISKSAKVGIGTIIQAGCNVSSQVEIGEFVKLNTFSNIMHNSIIKDFTTIAPNAVILGHVEVGNHCYIGANSTILPHVKIADQVTIGAGAVVTKNIEEPGVYIGIPARKIKG